LLRVSVYTHGDVGHLGEDDRLSQLRSASWVAGSAQWHSRSKIGVSMASEMLVRAEVPLNRLPVPVCLTVIPSSRDSP
jgi:hypothetical protein